MRAALRGPDQAGWNEQDRRLTAPSASQTETTPTAPPTTFAIRPSGVDQRRVLGLQRWAGNRAVAQRLTTVVQRDGGWTQQVKDFKTAVKNQDWDDAAKRLNNFQRADWAWHVKDANLQPPQLAAIRQVVVNQPGGWGWQQGYLDFLTAQIGAKRKPVPGGPAKAPKSNSWEIRPGLLSITKAAGNTTPTVETARLVLADATTKTSADIEFQPKGAGTLPPDWKLEEPRALTLTGFPPAPMTTGVPVSFEDFTRPGTIAYNAGEGGGAAGARTIFTPGGGQTFADIGLLSQTRGYIEGKWVTGGRRTASIEPADPDNPISETSTAPAAQDRADETSTIGGGSLADSGTADSAASEVDEDFG